LARRPPGGLQVRRPSLAWIFSTTVGRELFADRLRTNLRLAGIPAPEADVERVLEEDSLAGVFEMARAMRDAPEGTLPDYVAAWAAEHEGERFSDEAAPATDAVSRTAREEHGASGNDAEGPGGALPDTIAGLAPLLRSGAVSPLEVVERALARVAKQDGQLNAFQLVLAERAREAARRAEAEIARGAWRGPLHGVPVAVKDLFAMRGTLTTAGANPRVLEPDTYDSAAIERLEAAGAIVIGKTRLPEFAFWPGSANPHWGPTANPHDPGRDAGGSSSGSAAAVAAGMAVAALGSDTGGSIRIPAALCGVVGLKPTFGRISLFGCTPLAWSLDHAGPLARSVEDAALLLATLAGHDPRDPRTTPGAQWAPRARPRGALRVGVLGSDGTGKPLARDAAMAAWRASCFALERAGATLVEVDLPEMAALRAATFLILSAEAASYHAPGLRSRYTEYGERCRTRLLAGFAYDAGDLVGAQRLRRAVRERWGRLFETIDVLSTPSQPDVAPPLGERASVKFTSPFNALGWPAVSVPFAKGPGGLPLATQLVARARDEATLLHAARALETAR
jgi:aspartyl-tRNA(Asn)/glutamyl-tRNA(Gln) amidotransferase subunit A